MKTEDLVRQERRDDPLAVSRALRDTAPLLCTVVDSHGKPVPLSSAGYVLRPGRSYRVRLVSPFSESDLQGVSIINPPDCVSVHDELKEVDEEGHSVRAIPFRTRGVFRSHARRLGFLAVQCEELEIAHYFQKGAEQEVPPFGCPIVIRTRWIILLLAVMVGLLSILLPGILTEVVRSGEISLERIGSLAQGIASDLHSWLWLILLTAVVALAAYAFNAGVLYRRSKELRNEFREIYPP